MRKRNASVVLARDIRGRWVGRSSCGGYSTMLTWLSAWPEATCHSIGSVGFCRYAFDESRNPGFSPSLGPGISACAVSFLARLATATRSREIAQSQRASASLLPDNANGAMYRSQRDKWPRRPEWVPGLLHLLSAPIPCSC